MINICNNSVKYISMKIYKKNKQINKYILSRINYIKNKGYIIYDN